MTLLGREGAALFVEILFTDIEIDVLRGYAKKKRLDPPVYLGTAVIEVARMGGYLSRSHDPPLWHQLMWRGYMQQQWLYEGQGFPAGFLKTSRTE